MANLFSGLDKFGLGKLSKLDVYEEEKKDEKKKEARKTPELIEEDVIFDKTFSCSVCYKEFKSKAIKAGRIKLDSMDTDLRPKYQLVDPLKYDAIVCPHCGYAALNRFFKYVSPTQGKLIKKNISNSFSGLSVEEGAYSYDYAIVRHKLALANSIVKKSKTSERAYTCLKTAWVIRGKREELPKDNQNYKKQVKDLFKEEMGFISNAYEGFKEAYSTEAFPMCGMDQNTVTLLVAELARKVGEKEEAGRWISQILVSRDANERIKERARDIKDLIQEDK